ncbi:hypothetical protein [Pseudarthrobacter sulfonivorans]|uniref:hypothetical protein n=1 Tax=Pseudarthrobacter sulfonivorans TaxID=121292 RepID=UPI0031E40D38
MVFVSERHRWSLTPAPETGDLIISSYNDPLTPIVICMVPLGVTAAVVLVFIKEKPPPPPSNTTF